MYQSKLAACLKVNGKVLREFKDEVYVPFGQEYSILLKNLNSVKALVNISIDGTDVIPGGLVIEANREIELERFVTDMNKGNRFKFIKRTAGIEQHRGIKIDDGLIRISFNFEKVLTQSIPNRLGGSWGTPPNHNDQWFGTLNNGYNTNAVGMPLRSMNVSKGLDAGVVQCSYSANASSATMDSAIVTQNVGITAPGSISGQKFQQASWFLTEAETHVMVLRLLGESETGKTIESPVTVKSVPICSMCGRKNKATAKFCCDCGTALTLV